MKQGITKSFVQWSSTDTSGKKPHLGPGDGSSKRRFDSHFLGILHESTQRTTTAKEKITNQWTFDSFLLTDLATDLAEEPQVYKRNEGHHSAHQAIISHRFGRLAEGVTRSTPSCEAKWNIVEAATEAIAPIWRHLVGQVLRRNLDQ